MIPHNTLQRLILAGAGRCDTDVAEAPLFFPLLYRLKLYFDAPEIVDLHEVKPIPAELFERIIHPLDAAGLILSVNFRGEPKIIPDPEFPHDPADNLFGVSVVG
jgi:hypothetical protein